MTKKPKGNLVEAGGGAGAAGVRAVDRAIAILQCFTPDQPALSVIEIQKRVALSRPTLYRLLQTLAQRDLVLAEGDPQRFRLSHGVMKLSHVWLKSLDVVALARGLVEGLRDVSGETAAMFRLQQDRGICILECESRHVLSISRGVGDSLSLTTGSTGKAILAFMEAERQAEFLSTLPGGAQRMRLEEEIQFARKHGYATSNSEIFAGAVAVSAPYFDHRGSVMGSIGIYGPSARVNEQKMLDYSKLVRKAGQQISALLGSPRADTR